MRNTVCVIGLLLPCSAHACVIYTPTISYLIILTVLLFVLLFSVDSAFRSKQTRVRRWQSLRPVLPFYAVAFMLVVVWAIVNTPSGCPGPARGAKARTEIVNLVSALQMYKLDNLVYPSTEQGLRALVEKPIGLPEAVNWSEGGYLHRLPKDPWGREYHYEYFAEIDEIHIYTFGRDGVFEGEGDDADISNLDR